MDARCSLIVIDPLYSTLAGKTENANAEMAELMFNYIRLAANAGAAVWICHHFSKGDQSMKAAIDRFSGAGAFGRAPDTVITMTPLEEEACYAVEFTLRDHPTIDKFGVRWTHPVMDVDATLNPDRLREPRRGAKREHDSKPVLQFL